MSTSTRSKGSVDMMTQTNSQDLYQNRNKSVAKSFFRQLKTEGFPTRDARAVERKKYGRPGARKSYQFSKR